MEQPSLVERTAISARLKALGRDRAWLAEELHVSEGVVNQWLSAKGTFPRDRHVAVTLLLDREEHPVRIGDPEGNLLAFTIEEFERIEATRLALHYETRPALYRDAILAFVEQEESAQDNVVPMVSPEGKLKAAEDGTRAVPETRREVSYRKKSKDENSKMKGEGDA